MASKTTNKFSPEVRARAVQMVLDHEAEHPSRWQAMVSIAAKIGCSAHDKFSSGINMSGSPAEGLQTLETARSGRFPRHWSVASG